jgi:hypothetical protein
VNTSTVDITLEGGDAACPTGHDPGEAEAGEERHPPLDPPLGAQYVPFRGRVPVEKRGS